jgi:hypothetical protein
MRKVALARTLVRAIDGRYCLEKRVGADISTRWMIEYAEGEALTYPPYTIRNRPRNEVYSNAKAGSAAASTCTSTRRWS